MKNKKYFAVDVSNDIHIVELHETLEQAKQSCLKNAVDAYDFANDMDSFEEYLECDIPYAIYGTILGRATSTTRQLTDEEEVSGDYCDGDEITNPPEIVELNGWISVDERLPEERQTVLIAIKNGRDYAISMATYQKHYEKMKWIEPNYDYYGIEEVTLDLNQVAYWQPLPQPPETE